MSNADLYSLAEEEFAHDGKQDGIFIRHYTNIIEKAGGSLKRHIQVSLSGNQSRCTM